MTIEEFLKRQGACSEGTRWVRRLGFKRAYQAARRSPRRSERSQWLVWFCRRLSIAAKLSECWCMYCDSPPKYKVAAATLRRLK